MSRISEAKKREVRQFENIRDWEYSKFNSEMIAKMKAKREDRGKTLSKRAQLSVCIIQKYLEMKSNISPEEALKKANSVIRDNYAESTKMVQLFAKAYPEEVKKIGEQFLKDNPELIDNNGKEYVSEWVDDILNPKGKNPRRGAELGKSKPLEYKSIKRDDDDAR